MTESRRAWFRNPLKTRSSSPLPSVAGLLDSLSLAPSQQHKLLTVWPLLLRDGAPAAPGVPYVTLADALACGALRVGELSGGAVVSRIEVENRGDNAVLVLFGEELRGAKQNRVANASFLVPAHAALEIDVSCVEQGRWGTRSRRNDFRPSEALLSHALRRKMQVKVAAARGRGGRFDADQAEVWTEVGDRLRFSAADSDTAAYAAYTQKRTPDVQEAARAFHPLPGQVGFVAAMGDEIVGLEAIGREAVFARAFDRLLRGYLVDAVDAAQLGGSKRAEARAPRFEAPEPFLDALAKAPATEGPSLGLGRDVRVRGRGVAGCALVHGAGEVVHLTAFAEEGA
jgi:hypothetical protein